MTERDASDAEQPTGTPPDERLAYDPEMTEADEANIPRESDADPQATEEPGDEELTPPR